MANKQKARTAKRAGARNPLRSKRALLAKEKQLRAALGARLRRGPAYLLRSHVELLGLLIGDLETRVTALRWYQTIMADVAAKAGRN